MDLLKHGESAYPADAWVEQQYMSENAVLTVSSQKPIFSFHWKMVVTFCNKKVHKESTKCFVCTDGINGLIWLLVPKIKWGT